MTSAISSVSWPILAYLVLSPALGALAVALMPANATNLLRRMATAVSLLPLLITGVLWNNFDAADGGFQFVQRADWIPNLGASWLVGIDGISLLIIALTVVLTPLVLISSRENIHHQLKGYLASMLLLEATVLGALVAIDLLLFYVFWELMLVPMFVIIGVWGGQRRVYASLKFLLFTMVGSLPMLVAIIYLALAHGWGGGQMSFALPDLYSTVLSPLASRLCFFAFFLGFAVKVPMFPIHTWLPDAHVEAPTGGSVILAGVLLKMGTYGFIRFLMPLFPEVLPGAMPWIGGLAVIGIIYGALVAMVQPDMKKLVAYSSVSHLGFVMLGLASMNAIGVSGAVYQMLNHGVSTGALFFLVGIIYERRHTRLIADYGGLWKQVPVYSVLFLIVMLSSIGLPGMNGFIGEFLILLGAFKFNAVLASFAVVGVILGAAYMMWMYQRVIFGPITSPENEELSDVSPHELGALLPLVALIFVMGIFPQPFLAKMQASVEVTLAHAHARTVRLADSDGAVDGGDLVFADAGAQIDGDRP